MHSTYMYVGGHTSRHRTPAFSILSAARRVIQTSEVYMIRSRMTRTTVYADASACVDSASRNGLQWPRGRIYNAVKRPSFFVLT